MAGSQCEVRRALGSALRRIPRYPGANALIQDFEWEDWLHEVELPSDKSEYEWLGRNNKTRNLTNFVSQLQSKGAGSKYLAAALYYRLHYHVEDLSFANEVDRSAFRGKTFAEISDSNPVFSITGATPKNISTAPFSYPPYKTKEQVAQLLAQNPDHGIWLDPHNHHTIPLSGRSEELRQLNDFMEGDTFRILPLVGPSGSGKTRLISEWMYNYVPIVSDTDWDAGLVVSTDQNARDPAPWQHWDIQCNTLVVIDYTHAFSEVARAIVERACAQNQHKVRLIVVDHVYPELLHHDRFWLSLAGNHPSQLSAIESQYIAPKIVLDGVSRNSSLLAAVVLASANVHGGDYNIQHPMITAATDQLERMAREQGGGDSVRHPLFAALLGQAIRKSGPKQFDASKWSRRDLLNYYFSGVDRLPWTGWNEGERYNKDYQTGLLAGALVSAATLRRGLDTVDAEPFLKSDDHVLLQTVSRIVSEECTFRIGPFLPDILGEAFLLKFLEKIEGKEDLADIFFSILYRFDSQTEESVAENIRGSIARLVRNLANDNPERPDVARSWTALAWFLNPKGFPKETRLRLAMQYSSIDVLDQISQLIDRLSEHTDGPTPKAKAIMRSYANIRDTLFSDQMISDFILTEEEDDLFSLTRAAFCYFEHTMSEFSRTDIEHLEIIRDRFSEMSDDGETAAMVAAVDGRTRVLDALLTHLGEDISAVDKERHSAFNIACGNGHLETAKFLYQRMLETGMFPDDVTLSLCAASANGQFKVVAYLSTLFSTYDEMEHAYVAALSWAVVGGHLEIVKYLHGPLAKVNSSKLSFAMRGLVVSAISRPEIFHYLVENDATPLEFQSQKGSRLN